jgi:hypothetical protein
VIFALPLGTKADISTLAKADIFILGRQKAPGSVIARASRDPFLELAAVLTLARRILEGCEAMAQVFISYVEEDSQTAVQIAGGLEAAGYSTWYYERENAFGPP